VNDPAGHTQLGRARYDRGRCNKKLAWYQQGGMMLLALIVMLAVMSASIFLSMQTA